MRGTMPAVSLTPERAQAALDSTDIFAAMGQPFSDATRQEGLREMALLGWREGASEARDVVKTVADALALDQPGRAQDDALRLGLDLGSYYRLASCLMVACLTEIASAA